MNRDISVSILFIYALIVSLLAYLFKDLNDLAVIGIVNGVIGAYYGYRYKLLWLLLLLGFWGTFINAVAVANTGPVLAVWGPIVIRMGVIEATLTIFFRLLSIVGATLFFIGNSTPYEIAKSLVAELRIPKGLAFALSYALRLIPLMKKDLEEVMVARLERGYRRIPYFPGDLKTFLMPLLSIAYERAVWTGIAVELRGFRIGRVKYRRIRFGKMEFLVVLILVFQIILAIMV